MLEISDVKDILNLVFFLTSMMCLRLSALLGSDLTVTTYLENWIH